VQRRILVVKLADLGDLLTVTPALRALRLSLPDARIDALVTPGSASLLAGSDAVDRVIRFNKFAFDSPGQALHALPLALQLGRRLRTAGYDTLVLLHHLTTAFGTAKYAALTLASGARIRAGLDNGRGRFLTHRAPDLGFGERHEVDYWLSVVATLGASNPRPRLELPIPPDADQAAAKRWGELGLTDQRAAVIHPGSGAFSLARRWSPERFAAVADRLAAEQGMRILVLAGPAPGERELAREVVDQMTQPATILDGVPSVQELAALLRRASLFVGNDSGVMHLASAVETPVVAIFGPTNHRAWGPYPPDQPRNGVVHEPLACSPCIHRGHSFGTPAGCPARTCLQIVEPGMVVDAAVRVVGARNG
jgi:ADP-heptose:LPS heptosyltransferase